MADLSASLSVSLSTSLSTDLSAPAALEVPETIPGLVAWWRADSGITLNGADVSAWLSKVNGHVLSQGTAARQPLFTAADANFNGEPVVDFRFLNTEFLDGPAALAATLEGAFTIGADLKLDTTAAGGRGLISGFTAANPTGFDRTIIYCATGNSPRLLRQGSAGADEGRTGVAPVTTAGTYMGRYDGSNVEMWQGNTEGAPVASTRALTQDAFVVGGLASPSIGAGWDGPVAELCLYDNDIGAAPADALRTYFQARYGNT